MKVSYISQNIGNDIFMSYFVIFFNNSKGVEKQIEPIKKKSKKTSALK